MGSVHIMCNTLPSLHDRINISAGTALHLIKGKTKRIVIVFYWFEPVKQRNQPPQPSPSHTVASILLLCVRVYFLHIINWCEMAERKLYQTLDGKIGLSLSSAWVYYVDGTLFNGYFQAKVEMTQ